MSVLGLVVIAPFERPLASLGAFTVTSVEVAIVLALTVSLAAHLVARTPIAWRTPLTWPGVAFLSVVATAALAAPVEQGNALRFAARMFIAGAVFVITFDAIDTRWRARAATLAVVGVAAVVAIVALLESAQIPWVMAALTAFRPGFHVVAGQLRATSTMFYPTIASMYLEVAFAFGLWLLLDPGSSRPRLERAAVFLALAIIAAGVVATFTRAGLLAMAAALAIVAALRYARLPAASAGGGLLAGLALVICGLVFVSNSTEFLLNRMQTEGSQAWYGARYEVPLRLQLQTGRIYQIPITLTNTGRLTWDSAREPAFAMSYHWLRAATDAVVQFDGQRTAFERPIAPGAVVTMPVDVIAPGQPGSYTLVWDVVHETRAWLSTEGVTAPRTAVEVSGAPAGAVVTKMNRLPGAIARPTRPALWGAALQIAAERPFLGVGPDNFRQVYGRYAGLDRWDTRVHANNMYLEILTGAGIPGLIALLWLVGAAGLWLLQRWARTDPAHSMPLVAAIVVWVAIAGHGLVDSFLAFTTTYLVFALAAGLALSHGFTAARHPDAHRV